MCLIIHRPPGAPSVTKALLREAYLMNRDGWGVMGKVGNRVVVHRGFGFSDLVDAVEAMEPVVPDLLVHLRYATHGHKNTENTHPYLVTPGLWLMHNGQLRHIPIIDEKRSDTWHFAKMLGEEFPEAAQLLDEPDFVQLLEMEIRMDRMVLLRESDGKVVRLNDTQWHEWDGLYLSNLNCVGCGEDTNWDRYVEDRRRRLSARDLYKRQKDGKESGFTPYPPVVTSRVQWHDRDAWLRMLEDFRNERIEDPHKAEDRSCGLDVFDELSDDDMDIILQMRERLEVEE